MANFTVVVRMMLLVKCEKCGEDGREDDGVEPGEVCLVLIAEVVRYDVSPLLLALGPHEHAQLCAGLAQQQVFVCGDDSRTIFPM